MTMDILLHYSFLMPPSWGDQKGSLPVKHSTILLNSNAKGAEAYYHASEWTNYVPWGWEGCNPEAKDFCGGGVSLFLSVQKGWKALLAGKTLLPLDQSIGFGGAEIFSLHQAAAEPTETSVGLLLRKVNLNFTGKVYHPLCFMA